MQFLSDEWATAYSTLLNEDPTVQKKFKRFSSLFKYSVTDREDILDLVIEVTKGKCTSFGQASAFNAKDIEFKMAADVDTWQKIFGKELDIKEAVSTKKLDIDGPKLKAISNQAGLKQSAKIMLAMEDIVL